MSDTEVHLHHTILVEQDLLLIKSVECKVAILVTLLQQANQLDGDFPKDGLRQASSILDQSLQVAFHHVLGDHTGTTFSLSGVPPHLLNTDELSACLLQRVLPHVEVCSHTLSCLSITNR